jgi:hypothetical protein
MDDLWSKELAKEDRVIAYPTDEITLQLLRKQVDRRGSWGWYIWEEQDIPKDNTSKPLPTDRPPKMSKRHIGKDVVYQKWRSKYNNENLMSTEVYKQKRIASKHKYTTVRRILNTKRDVNTGYTINTFGTLVGMSDLKNASPEMKIEQVRLVERMKAALPQTPKDLAAQLTRTWEITYGIYNGISQDAFRDLFEQNNLTIVSHYLYYETYALKICQLEYDIVDFLYLHLCQIASVMQEIFARSERDTECYTLKDEFLIYNDVPAIGALIQISAFFRESEKIFMQIHHLDANNRDEIMDAVSKNATCDVIFELTKLKNHTSNRFGVACLGVPFISGLTEKQAIFVFATSPDVFGFNPDRSRHKKGDRINSLIEFLRRVCLGIDDRTKVDEMNDIQK